MPKIQLTPHFIKTNLTCPSNKSRIEYCDTTFPGLYIEVRATSPGQGTYYLRYKDANKKTCHQKISRTYELTLTQARKQAKALKAEILLGADPRAEAKREKQVMTFKEFALDHYLPHVKKLNRSWRNKETMLRLRILDVFGNDPLNRITRKKIQNFHTGLMDEDLSAASCDHHIKLIRHALNLAVQWDLLGSNPADKIPLFKEDNKKERYMTEVEQARLLHTLKTDKNRTVCLVILFLLSTGARLNEALKASWEYVDIDNRVWRIPATNSKSKKVRSVPLNQSAINVLTEIAKTSNQGHLFINQRTGKRYTNINKTWHRIRKEAGLPTLRLHDLRHQYASHLVNSGRSLYEVQQILGHSDPTVTQRYAHLSTRALQEAAESAAACLGDVMTKTA